jgi:formylglycine-generating enzyme required for sulfatase activity
VTALQKRPAPLAAGLAAAAAAVVMIIVLALVTGDPESSGSISEPTPAATAPMGPQHQAMLVIRSNQNDDVAWLDGEALGPTRQEVQVSAGRHLVAVTKEGCQPEQRWIEVEAGHSETVRFELECGASAHGPRFVGEVWTDPVAAIRFRYIPAGTFTMGSPDHEPGRNPDEAKHQVTISRGLWLAETEVTQGQWEQVMASNPSHHGRCGSDCPVEFVTWLEAVDFANRLSHQAGFEPCYRIDGESVTLLGLDCPGFRLPTEAEWEYAARAGSLTPFCTGAELPRQGANFAGSERPPGAAPEGTLPVASFAPNLWGLHDVHGNVREWVWDGYGSYPPGRSLDPTGPGASRQRVHRGGSCDDPAQACRAAHRGSSAPDERRAQLGLRLARTVSADTGS